MINTERVRFLVPTYLGHEKESVSDAIDRSTDNLSRFYADRVERELSALHGTSPAMFVTSCTAALHLCGLILDFEPGDEVIVPSYTFVSTAVSFALAGATIVFADVNRHTLCLDPDSVSRLINPRTRAVVAVHYGGASHRMVELAHLCNANGIELIEDNAHGLGGSHEGRTLGTWGALSTLSFDAQKNLQCGEGGGLVINNPRLTDRARTLRERGTNRHEFMTGAIAEYTWTDLGGNFSPPDYVAAYLVPQLEQREQIQRERSAMWRLYNERLGAWAAANDVRVPLIPDDTESTHHIFWLVFPDYQSRLRFAKHMDERGIDTPSHYTSLSLSEGARKWARATSTPVSDDTAQRLLRLPLYHSLTSEQQNRVIDAVLTWQV